MIALRANSTAILRVHFADGIAEDLQRMGADLQNRVPLHWNPDDRRTRGVPFPDLRQAPRRSGWEQRAGTTEQGRKLTETLSSSDLPDNKKFPYLTSNFGKPEEVIARIACRQR